MKQFETDRLIVRNFLPGDGRDLYEYLSVESVLKYEPGDVCTEEDCAAMARERAGGNAFWAACLKETGKMIGHVYFDQTEPREFMTWEIGYIFNPEYSGKGYATEACRRVLEYGFEELGAHRIIGMCNPENSASWRLLERLSMRREGYFRKKAFFRKAEDGSPIWHDAYEYAILHEEWEQRKDRNSKMEIIWSRGLTPKNLDDIKNLEDECRKAEPLEMKLNWDMLETRNKDESNDILCYENGELAAFLGLYAISPTCKEIEATGMVHPKYRRRGIFKKLHEMALLECVRRGAERVLLIAERCSVPAMAFIKKTGASYEHSEYRMRCDLASLPDFACKGVTLRKAAHGDYAAMKKLDSICFGEEVVTDDSQDEARYGSSLVAELNEVFIGKIGISNEAGTGYIYGFSILPEYRGMGYGREVLSRTLRLFRDDNLSVAILEVAVENDNALKLYTTSGFKETTVYDYFKIML